MYHIDMRTYMYILSIGMGQDKHAAELARIMKAEEERRLQEAEEAQAEAALKDVSFS